MAAGLMAALPAWFVPAAFSGQPPNQDDLQFTKDGKMILPTHYREWIFVTSGLGMTYRPVGASDSAGDPRFDNVFVNPAAYKAFLQTGKWPDKTVLILEVRGSTPICLNLSDDGQTCCQSSAGEAAAHG